MTLIAEPERRRSRLPVLLPVLVLSLLALLAVSYRLPYFVIAPGSVQRVDELIELPPERVFPHGGEFLLTSVAVRDVTPFELVRARLDPDVAVVRVRELTGMAPTPEARRRFDADLRQSMQISQHVAVRLAFERLGIPLPKPGEVLIDAKGTGGASGGLALTLGLLDSLGSGELTGGHRVAVTGSILPNGIVGDVDGVAQKAAAARSAGAEYLFVPAAGFGAAVSHAGRNLKVVKVSTLDEALAALAQIGGQVGEPG